MPWKECRKMDEKLRFVSRFLDGEKIASPCREFGISRVTGHKIIDRPSGYSNSQTLDKHRSSGVTPGRLAIPPPCEYQANGKGNGKGED